MSNDPIQGPLPETETYLVEENDECHSHNSPTSCPIQTFEKFLTLTSPLCVCSISQRKMKLSKEQDNYNPLWLTLKQAARATLILIPLLGIHYFIIPLRP